jgi:predicted nucleic acid-binding Zn ribbon protein
LAQPLIDIRFSSARWYQKHQGDLYDTSNLSVHPSSLNLDFDFSAAGDLSKPTTPLQAFLKWRETIKRRSSYMSTCPLCQGPTPEGELKRWQMCAYCVTKKSF